MGSLERPYGGPCPGICPLVTVHMEARVRAYGRCCAGLLPFVPKANHSGGGCTSGIFTLTLGAKIKNESDYAT